MTKIKGKRVFLSGPMTGLDCYNVGAFAEAHHRLRELGAAKVYDPAIEYLNAPGWQDMSHEDYVQRCLSELVRFDLQLEDGAMQSTWNRYWDVLVRLVCPQGGTVLDPFAGSGSTGVACVQEGMRFLGIEMDPHYCEIADARIGGAS